MIPIIFDSKATSFTTNGLGRLVECSSCICTEELNGEYEIEFKYPVTGRKYDQIQIDNIVVVRPAEDADMQPFRIYKISKPLNGIVTVSANHISYQLCFIPLSYIGILNMTPSNALNEMKSNILDSCPYTFSTNLDETEKSMEIKKPLSVRNFIGEFVNTYGGELIWKDYSCQIVKSRGTHTSSAIRYGKNLTSFKQDDNAQETVTSVIAYFKKERSRGEGDKKEQYTVFVKSALRDSQYLSNFPYRKTALIDATSAIENVHQDDAKDEDGKTVEYTPPVSELNSWADTYIKEHDIGIPKSNITISFVNLRKMNEYKNFSHMKAFQLGDWITVEFPRYKLSKEMEVVKTKFNVLLDRYDSIEVGTIKDSISGTIAKTITSLKEKK